MSSKGSNRVSSWQDLCWPVLNTYNIGVNVRAHYPNSPCNQWREMGTSKAELINNSPKKMREGIFFSFTESLGINMLDVRVSIPGDVCLRSLILLLGSCKCFNVNVKTPPKLITMLFF